MILWHLRWTMKEPTGQHRRLPHVVLEGRARACDKLWGFVEVGSLIMRSEYKHCLFLRAVHAGVCGGLQCERGQSPTIASNRSRMPPPGLGLRLIITHSLEYRCFLELHMYHRGEKRVPSASCLMTHPTKSNWPAACSQVGTAHSSHIRKS